MNVTVSFEPGISVATSKIVIESTFSAKKIIKDFFHEDFLDIKVVVAKDHESMCTLIGKDRPKSGVTTNQDDTIYLYDPSLWKEDETGHTLVDLTESLIHQMVHLFFRRHTIKAPVWFEEGVAVYVGANLSFQKREKEFSQLLNQHGFFNLSQNIRPFGKHDVPAYSYLTAYKYIATVIKEIGQKKMVELLLSIKETNKFEETFEKKTGMSVTYSWNLCEKMVLKESI